MLVYGRDRDVARWVGERLDVFDFGPCSAIGIVRDGHLVAGAVFHQYRHPSIEMSFASTTPRWASRDVIRAIVRYAFLQLNCRRLTCITPEENERAITALERVGFRREGRHPEALPTGTAVSLGLLRDQADRWL